MITLTRTQEGALRYMAGQPGTIGNGWGKPTVQTYKKLCALGLLKQSNTFPYHRATASGHDWIVAKDNMVNTLMLTRGWTVAALRQRMAAVQAGSSHEPHSWNYGRACAVIRELDRRASLVILADLAAEYRGRLAVSEPKRIKHQGLEFDCTEFRIGSKHGLRVWVRRNVATGQLDYRVIQGDGTTHRFWLYEYNEAAAPVQVSQAVRRLHDGHFDGAAPIDRTLDNH